LTNTQATAGRYHFEEAKAAREPEVNPSRTGVAVFADDFKSIRAFAERDNSDIVHWSEFPDGGHFAAMERPDVLVGDLRTFFRS
jgi:pimeloyl-ACP methyl ester carboxylesterase